jgi:hypothetical protein
VIPTTPPLQIVAIKAQGNLGGFVELHNNTTCKVSTVGMNLRLIVPELPHSNFVWEIPTIEILMGETVRFGIAENVEVSIPYFRLFTESTITLNIYTETLDSVFILPMYGDQIQRRSPDGDWRLEGTGPFLTTPRPVSQYPGISVRWTAMGVQITGKPLDEEWYVSAYVDVWPPSGGPWGTSPRDEFIYEDGILTIKGFSRSGFTEGSITWGYW